MRSGDASFDPRRVRRGVCVIEEVHSDAAQAVVAIIAREGACVPALWHLETGQALLVAEHQGRLTRAERQVALVALSDL